MKEHRNVTRLRKSNDVPTDELKQTLDAGGVTVALLLNRRSILEESCKASRIRPEVN